MPLACCAFAGTRAPSRNVLLSIPRLARSCTGRISRKRLPALPHWVTRQGGYSRPLVEERAAMQQAVTMGLQLVLLRLEGRGVERSPPWSGPKMGFHPVKLARGALHLSRLHRARASGNIAPAPELCSARASRLARERLACGAPCLFRARAFGATPNGSESALGLTLPVDAVSRSMLPMGAGRAKGKDPPSRPFPCRPSHVSTAARMPSCALSFF